MKSKFTAREAAEILAGLLIRRLGESSQETVPRALEGGGETTPLHKAADAHVPDLKVALQYAFAATRLHMQGLKPEELEEKVPEILQRELEAVLPGALTRAAISGASIALSLKTLGGPGSGNFGHAGRPGQVGGSAPDDAIQNAKIALEDLTEQYGEQIPYAAVFSKFDENFEALNIYNELDQSYPGEVETLDPASLIATQEDLNASGLEHYLQGKGPSVTENPIVLRFGGKNYLIDGHHRAGAAILLEKKTLTVEVYDAEKLLPKAFGRALGGPGSGNFGHAGRPGQVGGSAPDEFPEGLVKVSGPKGTNPGGVFRDKEGRKWYVKQYKDADQAAGEHIANAVYSRIGVDAADSRLSADGKTIALRWEDGKVLNQHGLDPDTANRVLDGFAGDVLLQNWDAVGTGHDNVLVRPDGSVMRVDQGGTLLHRAQGALKPQAGRHEIREWESLQTFNPYYAEVFKRAGVASGDALGERVAKQIDRIVYGRPEGGWEVLVSRVAPLASPSYKKAVSGMLEARQGLLEKKRDALRMKTLGGPGSGHFGHSFPVFRALPRQRFSWREARRGRQS